MTLEPFQFRSVSIEEGDVAVVTFSIPRSLLDSFKSFLSSSLNFVSFANSKARIARDIEKVRSEEFQQKLREDFARYSEGVVNKFDSFASSGLDPRKAIRATADNYKASGHHVTCYQVELIVRAAGRLSKRQRRAA